MSIHNRVPSGVPAGGQFAEVHKPEAEASLTSPGLVDITYDTSTPVPQADDLDKIATVPQLIKGGADTPSGLACGLNVSERQGGYYMQAACHLGLVERGSGPEYHLTDAGELMSESDDDERAELMAAIAADSPNVTALEDGGEGGFYAQLEGDLGETTAQRRLQTAQAWRDQSRNVAELAETTRSAGAVAKTRLQVARTISQQAKRRRSQPDEPAQRVCQDCFMVIPQAHEICPDCGG